MEKKTIQIQVRADLAERFEAFSEEKKRKIETLLSLRLNDLMKDNPPIEEIMDRMSDYAQSQGLTPKILESILNDE